MAKENFNSKISFPSWDIIERYNDTNQRDGYEFKQQISGNLYVRISCQNEKVIDENFFNVLNFSFCNKEDLPIMSTVYVYCEEGYNSGIKELLKWAESLEKTFCAFRNKSGLM